MNWHDNETSIEIFPPKEFSFEECLVFLGRSDQEVLHQIEEDYLYKLIKVKEELTLLKISCNTSIKVEFPLVTPSKSNRKKVAEYIWDWFDLGTDLRAFYELASHDPLLKPITQKYFGLRIINIPDLFEALTWAIIGQQINLNFAYTLKKRFIEQYGDYRNFQGNDFWLFPTYETVSTLEVEDLRRLQFTTRKSEYVIGIAKTMAKGDISKDSLLYKDSQEIKSTLMNIRGVGDWTADYVMMKNMHHPAAFPIGDVGLQNALKIQLGLDRKPSKEEMQKLGEQWTGWEAYATFYLWRSLYDETVQA